MIFFDTFWNLAERTAVVCWLSEVMIKTMTTTATAAEAASSSSAGRAVVTFRLISFLLSQVVAVFLVSHRSFAAWVVGGLLRESQEFSSIRSQTLMPTECSAASETSRSRANREIFEKTVTRYLGTVFSAENSGKQRKTAETRYRDASIPCIVPVYVSVFDPATFPHFPSFYG